MNRISLILYFALLPVFFSASALSWPFPDAIESAPPSVRDWPGTGDCPIAPSQAEAAEDELPVEEEEPDCE